MLKCSRDVFLAITGATLLGCVVGCPSVSVVDGPAGDPNGSSRDPTPTAFVERWETSMLETLTPAEQRFLSGDSGNWVMGDSISNSNGCGPTPHTIEIISHRGSNAVRITSRDSSSNCSDNTWIQFINETRFGNELNVLVTESTSLTFFAEFAQENLASSTKRSINLTVEDVRGNTLVYVLQETGDQVLQDPSDQPTGSLPHLREFRLNSADGNFQRNLMDDFRHVPLFSAIGAKIRSIALKVGDHGWVIMDDLVISDKPEDFIE